MLQHLFMQVLVLIMTLTIFGSPVDVHATVMRRQAQIPATPPVVIPMPTTTSSFNYWWPYPPAGASTTTIPSAQSSVVQPSSSLSATIPASVTGSIPSASSSSSLQPSSSSNTAASSNALPTTQTALHPIHPKFKFYYLYPVFGVVGILIIALAAWIIYGCCTRKPRTRDHSDDNSILGGPRYVPVDEKVLRDVEAGDRDAMQEHQRRLELRNKEDGQFRWPSYDLTDYWNGHRREKTPFLRPPLPVKGSSDRTAKSARTTKSKHTSRSTRTSTSTRPGSKKTQNRARNGVLSPKSDSTSLACLELYSSDEEAEEKAKQVPWESLRHKSIKRGILERVRKDGSWRDSVRAVAGSAFADKVRAGLGGGVGNVERPNAASRRSTGDVSTYPASEANGGASTTRANSTRTTTTYDEGEGHWLKGPGFRMVTESPAPNPPALLNAFGYGQDDVISEDDEECDDENDRFTPMPTPRLGSRRSRSNSKSSSPVKSKPIPNKPTTTTIVRANLGGTTPSVGRLFVDLRDVLPKSPPQIMSPPLESQLCFTPMAAATARMQKNISAPTRTRTIPKPQPGNRSTNIHPSQPSLLPMPEGLGGHTAKTLVKRPPPPPNPPVEVGKESEKEFPVPFTPDSEKMASKETMEEAMRTIEKIVEASWSARDLERQVAGSLSPNGVGSRA